MQQYKPAMAKMVLGLDKGRSAPPAKAPTAAPAYQVSNPTPSTYKPASAKRPAPTPAPAVRPQGNSMQASSATSGVPKVPLKPAPKLPALAKPSGPAPATHISQPMQSPSTVGDTTPQSLSASSLGSTLPICQLRICTAADLSADHGTEQMLFECSAMVDSVEQETSPWKLRVADSNGASLDLEYWPAEGESSDRIQVGSSYRFIGRAGKSVAGSGSSISIVAIKQLDNDEEALMQTLQQTLELKKNEA